MVNKIVCTQKPGISILLAILLTADIYAGSQLSRNLTGEPLLSYNAACTGVGNSVRYSIDDATMFLVNPGVLGFMEARAVAAFNLGVLPTDERVITVDEPVYHNFGITQFPAAVALAYAIIPSRLSIGIGTAVIRDNSYFHERYLYSPTAVGVRVKSQKVSQHGAVDKYTAGIGWAPVKFLSTGLNINMLNYYTNTTDLTSDYLLNREYIVNSKADATGYGLDLSAGFMVNDIRIGLIFSSDSTLTGTQEVMYSTSTSKLSTEIRKYVPAETCLVYEHKFSDIHTVIFNLRWVNNSVLTGNRNTLILTAGGECKPQDTDYAVRYGFFYTPFYADDAYSTAGVTTGAVYRVSDNFGVDLAIQYAKRNYIGDGTFFGDTQQIDETLTKCVVGISIKY
ncbi:MAG: hypothetical protein WC955_04215 [Elusimicrobiota bacterium]